LLAPLGSNQQKLIDLVAMTFVEERGQWPVFDYLEAAFDAEGLDATSSLASLPRDASGQYAAAWWPRTSSNDRPLPDARVALTVLGFHQSRDTVRDTVDVADAFLAFVRHLAELRRDAPKSRMSPTIVEITGEGALSALADRGFQLGDFPAHFLYELMEHEPATQGGAGSLSEGGWTHAVTRTIQRFGHVRTMEEYVTETVSLLIPYAPRRPLVTASPFGLVATIDYLDTVWRVIPGHTDHLFRIRSAQRTAQLTHIVASADEFDSRLTGLAELIRSVQVPKAAQKRRDRGVDPRLAALEAHLITLLPASQQRIRHAIGLLQAVLDIRDAGQHSAASIKARTGFQALGVAFPPASWPYAWAVVEVRTVDALTTLLEELATLTD
jgi:hypothetical protein